MKSEDDEQRKSKPRADRKARDEAASPAVERSLSDRQLAFCREYLVDLNGTQAAIRAGYSEKGAQVQASRLLSDAMVQDVLRGLMAARAERVEVTADTVLRELLQIATVDLAEAFNPDGSLKRIQDIPPAVRKAIAGIETIQIPDSRGEVKKVRFWDKNKALELLGRHLKLYTDRVEQETTVVSEATTLSPEQIAQVERIKARREALGGEAKK